MNPQYYLAHAMMAPVYMQTARFDRSARMLRQGSPRRREQQVRGLAGGDDASPRRAKREQAEQLLSVIMRRPAQEYISPVSIAYIFTALGDYDAAFVHLDRAIQDRDPNILGLKSRIDLRPSEGSDVRYHALLKKMQLE